MAVVTEAKVDVSRRQTVPSFASFYQQSKGPLPQSLPKELALSTL